MNFRSIYHFIFCLISAILFLSSCKFKEPVKNHGIIFLENRSEKIFVEKSNKNDGGEFGVDLNFADTDISEGDYIYADEDGIIISKEDLQI